MAELLIIAWCSASESLEVLRALGWPSQCCAQHVKQAIWPPLPGFASRCPQNGSPGLLKSSVWEPGPLTWVPPELLTFYSISGLLHTKLDSEDPLLTVTTTAQLSCCVAPRVLISAWNQPEGPQNMFYNL